MSPIITTMSAPAGRGRRVKAPLAAHGISASLTRYDGNSGSATFRGTIAFAPGAVTSAADLDTVSVLVNGSEPEAGIYIQLLDGRHADGSYRSAYVEFTASCGSSETVSCEVRFNRARTVPDVGSPVDAVERAPVPWCREPTLFALTDAEYLCNARVAPLPVLPLTHPSLSDRAVAWLTTGFDYWAGGGGTVGGAEYESPYPLYVRYIASGDVSFLQQALARWASDIRSNEAGSPKVVNAMRDRIANPADDHSGGTDPNPSSYTGGAIGSLNEAGNGMMASNYMTYALVGAEYARLNNDFQLVSLQHAVGDGTQTATEGGRAYNKRDATRQPLRNFFAAAPFSHIWRNTRVYRGPSGQRFGVDYPSRTIADRIQLAVNRWKSESTAYDRPAWWPHIWAQGLTLASTNDGVAISGGIGAIDLRLEASTGQTPRVGNGTFTFGSPRELTDVDLPASFGYTSLADGGTYYRAVCTTEVPGGGEFTVYDPYDNVLGTATVGTPYTTGLRFTITAGSTDFALGDAFYIAVIKNPMFQYVLNFTYLWPTYLNGGCTDPDILTNLDTLADFIIEQTLTQTVSGVTYYGLPYSPHDPAEKSRLEAVGINSVFATTCAIAYAWKYARSGHTDTVARDLYDAVAAVGKPQFRVYEAGNSVQGQTVAWKEFGEFFTLAFHAEYLRAGGSPTAWGL